jgi:hypothetical protein
MQQLQDLATKKMEEFNALKQKNDALDVAFTTLASAAQGGFIGYLLGSFSLDQAATQVFLIGSLVVGGGRGCVYWITLLCV